MPQTVQEVIDTIVAAVPGAPSPDTVDTLKVGNPEMVVTGIGTTFLITHDVIEHAIAQGINFIITHEPTFYSHLDTTEWLENDPCYQAKRRMLEEHHIAVWRFHDGLHSMTPDPFFTGIVKALGWEEYSLTDDPYICQLPSRTLCEVVDAIKDKLNLPTVRVVGDLSMTCSKAGMLIGAWGGRMQITMLGRPDIDLLICGEINEWETNIYVRDALRFGQHKALVIIGHAVSEEPGMQEILPWLEDRLPEIPITFLPAEQSLRWE